MSFARRYGDTALSENFADCGGMAKVLRALRELGPQPDVMLGGHRFTALQAFFVSSCFKWCTSSLPKRTAKDDDDKDAEWARLYSPLNMRCNVPLMNTPAFADAFSCAPGTVMNSKVRCDLF
ncbi:neprilysin-21-like [Dermacentor variabilis]|uniref:neprilysin-21-like n=1 Tax=Dermacentor variabilis TaxID=34621 RepID=UPI003F5B8A54